MDRALPAVHAGMVAQIRCAVKHIASANAKKMALAMASLGKKWHLGHLGDGHVDVKCFFVPVGVERKRKLSLLVSFLLFLSFFLSFSH